MFYFVYSYYFYGFCVFLLLAFLFHIEALAIMLCLNGNEYYSKIQTKPLDGT